MQTVAFAGDGLGDCAMRILSTTFRASLSKLDLSSNEIGDEGTEFLTKSLARAAPSLLELILDNNKIGDQGAYHIAELLGEHKRLEVLRLAGNTFGETGAVDLLNALVRNSSLVFIDITNSKAEYASGWEMTARLTKISSTS